MRLTVHVDLEFDDFHPEEESADDTVTFVSLLIPQLQQLTSASRVRVDRASAHEPTGEST